METPSTFEEFFSYLTKGGITSTLAVIAWLAWIWVPRFYKILKQRVATDMRECQIRLMHIHVLQDLQRFLKKAGYEIDVTDITADILRPTETETGKD